VGYGTPPEIHQTKKRVISETDWDSLNSENELQERVKSIDFILDKWAHSWEFSNLEIQSHVTVLGT